MKFKERLIDSNSTNYRDIPHLFIQNVKEKNFNDRDNHTMSGPKYSIKAHDTVVGAQSHTHRQKKNSLNKFHLINQTKQVNCLHY